MAGLSISSALTLGLGHHGGGGGGGGASYSNAAQYYAGSIGVRWPNKASALTGTTPTTKTKYANTLIRRSAPWVVPAGSSVVLALPAIYVLEVNANVNEANVAQNITIDAVSITYTDASLVVRTVNCATGVGSLSNGGVLDTSATGGGVIATTAALPADIPAWSNITIAVALSFTATAALIGGYNPRSGETFRGHDTSSFATVVNAGTALTGNSGSASNTVGGFLYGPAALFYKGADGRPIWCSDGDSISYGKGVADDLAVDGIMGIVEQGCARSTSGYRIPVINTGVAASAPGYTYATDPNYNPNIAQARRALIDQVATINGGTAPFTHHICEHGTNSLGGSYTTLAAFRPMMQARWSWLKAWHNAPVIQTTMIAKATSTDAFTTTANQTIGSSDQTTGTRFQWDDELLSGSPPSGVDYVVNTYQFLSWDTGSNRDKWKAAPGSYVTDVTDTVTGPTLILTTAPAILEALNLNGQVRLVSAVTGSGPYTVTTTTGASSGTYGARTAGTAVKQQYSADGVAANSGLHPSYAGYALVAPSYDALKAQFGAWVG